MATLTTLEKLKLEKLFDMGGGYVLDFHNRTFQEFFAENLHRDIYEAKYDYGSGSKANRLRAFWNIEPNHVAAESIVSLLEYWKTRKLTDNLPITDSENALYNECLKIADKLKQESTVENIEALTPNIDDKDFHLLAKSIRESIERGEPETAIDRLHTFVVRYIRELCDRNAIPYTKDTPLHSLFGGYIKFLKGNKLIDSEMTERILKSSIAVMDAFNDVRNNKSLAHDNKLLSYQESILIFNDIPNVIRFIESIAIPNVIEENNIQAEKDINLEDIPF